MTREDEIIEAYSAEANSAAGVSCAAAAGYATLTAPNEEGWWWYLEPKQDTSDAIPVEVYLHGGHMEAWSGKTKITTSYFGRWQKIAAPHWHTDKLTHEAGDQRL